MSSRPKPIVVRGRVGRVNTPNGPIAPMYEEAMRAVRRSFFWEPSAVDQLAAVVDHEAAERLKRSNRYAAYEEMDEYPEIQNVLG